MSTASEAATRGERERESFTQTFDKYSSNGAHMLTIEMKWNVKQITDFRYYMNIILYTRVFGAYLEVPP